MATEKKKYVLVSGRHYLSAGVYVEPGNMIELTDTSAENLKDKITPYNPSFHGVGMQTPIVTGLGPSKVETPPPAPAESAEKAPPSPEPEEVSSASPTDGGGGAEYTLKHRGNGRYLILNNSGEPVDDVPRTEAEAKAWVEEKGGKIVDGAGDAE